MAESHVIRKLNGQNYLAMLSNELVIQWECSVPFPIISQPPVMLSDDKVVLLGSGKIGAYSNGKQLWIQPQTGDKKDSFKAVATSNKKVLFIDSRKLVCLDDLGKIEWTFTKEEGDSFMTQPIIDQSGKVLVADNRALYIIN